MNKALTPKEIAAWLLGLKVGPTRLVIDDDPQLREPTLLHGDKDDAALFWAACCTRAGLRCAEATLGDEDEEDPYGCLAEFPNTNLHNAFSSRFQKVQDVIDCAILLENAVDKSGSLEALAELLRRRLSLSETELERFMFEHELVPGSLRVLSVTGSFISLADARTLDVERVCLWSNDFGFGCDGSLRRNKRRVLQG